MPAISLLASRLLLATTITGCATLVHGTTQEIPVASSPPGATVLIDDVPVGVTPMVATVSRKQAHVVSFVADSITIDRVPLVRGLSPWIAAGVALYYVPAIYDFATGAAYNLPRDTIRPRPDGLRAGVSQPAITGGVRAMAGVSSVLVGFGSGHAVAGLPARRFLVLDVVSGSAAAAGLIMGIGGVGPPAEILFFGGGGVLLASRVWQVVDVLGRTEPTRP